jgi:hypothetical protein
VKRRAARWLPYVIAVVAVLLAFLAASPGIAGASVASNVTVNFSKPVGAVSRYQLGLDITGYGGSDYIGLSRKVASG